MSSTTCHNTHISNRESMNIITWIKSYLTKEEVTTTQPNHRPCHDTLLYKYAERYLNSLNPNHRYDVREMLRSGTIVTHCTDVTLQEAKDYVRRCWIEAVPPEFIVEVTTSW